MHRLSSEYLQKQKNILADIKKRKAWYLSHPGVSEVIPVEALEAQELRVKDAERQLARVKGEAASYHDDQKAARKEARKEEVREYERGVTGWQQGWREQAARLREKDANPG